MASVERLVTSVDVRVEAVAPRTMSVSARHEAVLPDGSRLLLLDDRGWTSTLMQMHVEDASGDASAPRDVPDIWATASVGEIEADARTVVGPDEPFDGGTQEEAEAGHWAYLAEILRRQGVAIDPQELKRLPHDVVLSERLLARIGR